MDVFILHADAEPDTTFVRSSLVPALGLETGRVLLSSDPPLGMTIVQALERGVTASRVTIVVVSPALLHERWALFGEALAAHHAAQGGLLIPLLLADCPLPIRLEFRSRLDCRDPENHAREFARLRAALALPPPVEREIPCPYPGMRPYSAENAAVFCGRSRDVDDLVSRIAGGLRELYVIGPSGSGKSSLLRSGVVPRLERAGDPVIGEPFVAHVLRPGATPAQQLPAARSLGSQRTLIVIDQLEEIFTLADRGAEHSFIVKLDELRAIPGCHLAIIVRADFLGALMQSKLWTDVLRSYRHEIAPLRGHDLRDAITTPARRVGVNLEAALLDRLIIDAAEEPGSLPLVQETLVHLWARREHNLLTLAQYIQLGDGAASGLAVALARRADAAFTALDKAGQAIAQRVFVRLIVFGQNRPDTRRQQPISALMSGEPPEQLDATLRHLIDNRLLTADADRSSGEVLIDLAHEALITSWPRLQAWISAHRKTEPLRRYLELDAEHWARRARQGRRDIGLLDEGQLAELDEWFTPDLQRSIGVGDNVVAFVAASRTALANRPLAAQRIAGSAAVPPPADAQRTPPSQPSDKHPSFEVHHAGDTTLMVRSYLDINSTPALAEEIDNIIAAHPPAVTVDLSQLDGIDSSGTAALVKLYIGVTRRGGTFKIVGARDQPLAVFRLLRMDKVFNL